MGISLKDTNRPMLALVVLANIVIYIGVLENEFAIESLIATMMNIQKLFPVLLVSIFTGVLNAQIGHVNKARLVFWKWSH